MLIIGYVFGLRSERLLCRELQVNLAYRWFCKLGMSRSSSSAFSRARNERFRDGDIFAGYLSVSSGVYGAHAFTDRDLPWMQPDPG